MQLRLAALLVMFVLASAMTGCASTVSSSGASMLNNSDRHWLTRQPAMVGMVDGRMQNGSVEFSATEAVKLAILDLLAILGDETLRQPGKAEERRDQIEQVIRHRANYQQMSQRCLGGPWTRLPAEEQQEFVGLFVQLLRDAIANKIDQYYGEQVFYLVEKREGAFAEVSTNLAGPKVDTLLDFRLEKQSGNWLVYDVIIDGSSMVRNYRTQFVQIIRDDSYAGLVERMRQRALTVKRFEKTALSWRSRRPAALSLSRASRRE